MRSFLHKIFISIKCLEFLSSNILKCFFVKIYAYGKLRKVMLARWGYKEDVKGTVPWKPTLAMNHKWLADINSIFGVAMLHHPIKKYVWLNSNFLVHQIAKARRLDLGYIITWLWFARSMLCQGHTEKKQSNNMVCKFHKCVSSALSHHWLGFTVIYTYHLYDMYYFVFSSVYITHAMCLWLKAM